jgi:hypothetical protein
VGAAWRFLYQESLRIGERRPESSFLLVPSEAALPWLEQAAFHETHRVGVHPFEPGQQGTLPFPVKRLLAGTA